MRLAHLGALVATLLAPFAWAAPFTANTDGTVTDGATGLMWDLCLLGQGATGCGGGSTAGYNWENALKAARDLNAGLGGYKGYTDWRVPNVKELASLVDITRTTSPTIDTTAFPGTPVNLFWSSTTFVGAGEGAWFVDFGSGNVDNFIKTNTNYVRLVRSGQPFASFDALGDITAPAITAGPTATPGTNGATVSASVTVDEAATGFWQMLPAADPAPTVATLLALGVGQQVALAANVASTINISGLNTGTAYQLHFVARDGAGNVSAVVSTSFITPSEPGAPTGVSATPGAAGSGQVMVGWTVPADNGSIIVGYTINPAGTGAACVASPCVISGLANAAAYTFTVAATNGVGQGAASGPSNTAILEGTQAIAFSAQGGQTFVAAGTFAISPAATASSGLAVTYGSTTPLVCTVSGSTVSMVAAGTCTVTANQGGDSYWTAAPQATQNITIGKGTQTISFPAQGNQTFSPSGTFTVSPVATASSGLPVTYSSQTASVCTVSGSSVSIVSAGTCTIAANQAGDANWNAAAQAVQSITIGKSAQIIHFGAQANQTFSPSGTFAISPVATASSNLAVTYSSLTAGVCTVSGTTVTMVVAGTCTIAVDQAGDANWNAATQAAQNVAINKGTQTINFGAQGNQTFSPSGTFAINPAATASSSLAVVYSSQTGSVCSVSGSTVSMMSAGTCTIAADQAGDSNWNTAAQVMQNVTIGKGTQTITFPAQGNQTFSPGGTFAINPTATAASNLVAGYSSLTTGVCTVSGTTVAMVSAGVCTIAADQAGDTNWNGAAQVSQNVTIGKSAQTISFGVQPGQTYAAGGTFTINPQATASSGLAVTYSSQTASVCTVSGSTVTMVATGACSIAADQSGDPNWNAATQVTQNVTIGKGAQTITFPAQGNQTFSPGGTFAISPVATASSSLAVVYSSLTTSICTVSGSTVIMVVAGTCTIAADQAGDTNWNAATQAAQNVTIGKGTQTITFGVQSGQTYSFGGTFAISPTATASSGLAVSYSSQSASVCSVSGSTVTIVTAGTCSIAAEQAGDSNWSAAPQVTQSIVVGKATQTISFNPQGNQTYSPSGTFTINPLATALSGLAVAYTSQTASVCTVLGSTVTMVAAGTCTIAANQAGDTNWSAATQVTQNVVIGATIPGVPTATQATPVGSGQVTVTWTAPADTGGGITGYTVAAQPGGQTCTPTPPTATTCTFSSLTNGQTYTFTVQATNGAGTGPASAQSNPVTLLANQKAFSAPSPTGSGIVAAAVSGGGVTCGFEHVQLLTAVSAGAPAGRSFPHGVLDFVLSGCSTAPVTVSISYPITLPPGVQYWKRQGGTWGSFAGAVLGTSTATLTLVDGGSGDDDGAVNGRIVDPGGASVLVGADGAVAIPTLSEWGLVLLAVLLVLLAWRGLLLPQRRATLRR